MPSEKIVWIEIISHSGMLDFHVKIENAFAFSFWYYAISQEKIKKLLRRSSSATESLRIRVSRMYEPLSG